MTLPLPYRNVLTDLATNGRTQATLPLPSRNVLTDLATNGRTQAMLPLPSRSVLTDLATGGQARAMLPLPPALRQCVRPTWRARHPVPADAWKRQPHSGFLWR